MMMMLTIVLPNVSSVVSSSRGCFEKTEKKTPPLSGGALIRADREREFYAAFLCRFSYLFSSSFFRPKRHFCDEDDGLVKTKKKKNTAALFLSSLASCLLE